MKRIIVALVMIAWAMPAQAYTLVFEGDAVREILNLEIEGGLYNVEFANATYEELVDPLFSDPIPDEFSDGDFPAEIAIINALGRCCSGGFNVLIDGEVKADFSITRALIEGTDWIAMSAYINNGFGWDGFGRFAILPDAKLRAAVITPVPVPGAAWLFGSALGLLGWLKRRAA